MTLRLGPDWQRPLWASPYRLRFELNQGGPVVTQFTSSFDRVRTLCRAALPGDEVFAIVTANADVSGGDPFAGLEALGVPTSPSVSAWRGYWWEDDEDDEPWPQVALRLTWDQADILLWNQIAHDLGVTPQAPVMSKFVDVDRAICVHVYDDRGMDVTALADEMIQPLYARFDAWLLDHDRPRMSDAFEL